MEACLHYAELGLAQDLVQGNDYSKTASIFSSAKALLALGGQWPLARLNSLKRR